ncbi:MAG TPA: SRPBCC family protein [Solirubrobacteraceae bacterium]
MDPVTVSTTINKPREEIFDYLADIANHPEFSNHYLEGWRLTREDSWGQGAGARYRLRRRGRFKWGETTFVEVQPPHLIVGFGRGGKFNRVKTTTTWELSRAAGGTRIDFTVETEPALPSDRLAEFGLRRWMKRGMAKALQRLRLILEEGAERGPRATVAGR